ncbi:MAG: glycosyltransferase family 2 protein [Prochloron sp. SP5CPC1]|nr:glycosyltransferase family 2 protein [Candidatus Paraprochloron terpiosi SP5CPC1]
MNKIIIQIPCYNEETTLGMTLEELPKALLGVDVVELLVIDDGSIDRTVDVARSYGVDHLIHFSNNQGLAKAFMAGLEASVKAGADIIVNTDADNQYCAADIPKLIKPILKGEADMVVGARPIRDIQHFSPLKKSLQALGSWAVRIASNTRIPDAPSGFRAFSREAALKLNVFNEYTYTLETIIQAGQRGMVVTSVSVRTLRFFLILGSAPFSLGFLLGIRWLILYLEGTPKSHVPSLILSAILMLMGFQLWILGLVADLLAVNRKILEENQLHFRRLTWRKPNQNYHEP